MAVLVKITLLILLVYFVLDYVRCDILSIYFIYGKLKLGVVGYYCLCEVYYLSDRVGYELHYCK